MGSELASTVVTLHSGVTAAGVTTITPSGLDCSGCDHVRFVVQWGAITATGVQSAEIHQSSDDGAVDTYTAIAGTNVSVADDDDNKLTVIDIINPREAWLKCVINRATANSEVNGIIAIQDMGAAPSTMIAGDVQGYEKHIYAAEGAA